MGREEVLIPVQQAAEQVQRTYARLSSGECAIFSQEQTVFEDARQAAAALSDALAKAAHQLGDKVAELQQQLTEKQTALADLRRNIKDYPRGLRRSVPSWRRNWSSRRERRLR